MARPAPTITQAEMQRAIKAAHGAGLTVAEMVVTREGVRIITPDGANTGRATSKPNPWDEELSGGSTR